MEKLILVFYIDIGAIDSSDIYQFMKEVSENLKDEECKQFFIPIMGNGTKTKIECLNPKLLSENEYEDVRKKLEYITNKYEELYGKTTSTSQEKKC